MAISTEELSSIDGNLRNLQYGSGFASIFFYLSCAIAWLCILMYSTSELCFQSLLEVTWWSFNTISTSKICPVCLPKPIPIVSSRVRKSVTKLCQNGWTMFNFGRRGDQSTPKDAQVQYYKANNRANRPLFSPRPSSGSDLSAHNIPCCTIRGTDAIRDNLPWRIRSTPENILETIIPRLLQCFRTPFCHQNLNQEAVEDMEADYVPGFPSLVEDMMKKITQFIKTLKPAHGSLVATPGFIKSYWNDKTLWYGTSIDSVYVSSKYPGMWLIQCSEEPNDFIVLQWNAGLNYWYCKDYGFAIWFEEAPNEAGQGDKTAEIWVGKIFIENGKRINKMVRVKKKPKAGIRWEWKVKYGGAIAYRDAAPKLPIQYDPLEGPGWGIAYNEANQRENKVQDEDYVMVEKEPEDERLLEYPDELRQEEATTGSGLQWVSNAFKRRKTKKAHVTRQLTKADEEIRELLSRTVQEADIVSKKKAKQDAKIQQQQLEWEEARWHAERDQQKLKEKSTEGEFQSDRTDDSAHAQGKDAWKEAVRDGIPLTYVRIDGELYKVRRRTSAERMAYQEHLGSLTKSSREYNN